MRASGLTPLDLDPTKADTSGDGLRDDRVVDIDHEIRETRGTHELYAEVESAIAHPARVDSTGDGLTDREQIDGWEISVVDDHDAAAEMMSALADSDRDPDVAEYFETRTATADPLLNRTAGRLTDAEERSLGTDPGRADTTGDGISDARALELDEEDPTVFTTAPPDVTLHGYNHRLVGDDFEFPSWQYTYNYEIEDTVGLSSFELTREGVTKEDEDSLPYPVAGEQNVRITTSYTTRSEPILTDLRGADSEITVEDLHGNSDNVLLVAEQDVGTAMVSQGMAPREGGTVSGFTTGVAELPDAFRLAYHNQEQIAEALARFGYDYSYRGQVIVQIVSSMPSSIHMSQDRANPYDLPAEDPVAAYERCLRGEAGPVENSEYCRFAKGWYEGYAAFIIVKTMVGSKGLSQADTVGDVSTQLRRASDQMSDVPKALRSSDSLKTARINHRLMAGGGRDIDLPYQTAGKNAKAVKRLDEVDSQVLDRLDSDQRTELLRVVSEHDDGVRLVNDLGPEATQRLLRSDQAPGVLRTYTQLPSHKDRFATILRNDEASPSWIRVISDEKIGTGDVRSALTRIESQGLEADQITQFRTARDVNRGFRDDWQPPYEQGTIVTRFAPETDQTFVRVHQRNNQVGGFVMRESQIRGLSPVEIENKFSLSYTPEYVSDVVVPGGNRVNMGSVKRNFGGQQGATQFNLADDVPIDNFQNRRSLSDT